MALQSIFFSGLPRKRVRDSDFQFVLKACRGDIGAQVNSVVYPNNRYYDPDGPVPSAECVLFGRMQDTTLGFCYLDQDYPAYEVLNLIPNFPICGGIRARYGFPISPPLTGKFFCNPVNVVPRLRIFNPVPADGPDTGPQEYVSRTNRLIENVALSVSGTVEFVPETIDDPMNYFEHIRFMVVMDANPSATDELIYYGDSSTPARMYQNCISDMFLYGGGGFEGSFSAFLNPANAGRFTVLYDQVMSFEDEVIDSTVSYPEINTTWNPGDPNAEPPVDVPIGPIFRYDQKAKDPVSQFKLNAKDPVFQFKQNARDVADVDLNAFSDVWTVSGGDISDGGMTMPPYSGDVTGDVAGAVVVILGEGGPLDAGLEAGAELTPDAAASAMWATVDPSYFASSAIAGLYTIKTKDVPDLYVVSTKDQADLITESTTDAEGLFEVMAPKRVDKLWQSQPYVSTVNRIARGKTFPVNFTVDLQGTQTEFDDQIWPQMLDEDDPDVIRLAAQPRIVRNAIYVVTMAKYGRMRWSPTAVSAGNVPTSAARTCFTYSTATG